MSAILSLSLILNALLAYAIFHYVRKLKQEKKTIPFQRSQMLLNLLDSANIKLWKHDAKTNKIYYAKDDFSYDEGVPFDEHLMLKAEPDRQVCIDHAQTMAKSPQITKSLLRYRYIDPSTDTGFRYTNNYMYIQRDNVGTIEAVYSLEHDVTKDALNTLRLQKLVNDLKEASKNKSLFVANASHDIRTPLNGIIGFTQLLRYEENEAERTTLYDSIEECANQLQSLINDILDISKIEAGKMEYYYSRLHLDELMHDMINTYNVQKTEHQNIILKEPPTPQTIMFDRQRFIQIVNNFMSNAMKFTEKGDITLSYTYNDKDGLYLEVKDSGLGIREEDKPRVFMQFQKLNSDHQGTGLGLSICKQIVESQGGSIGFDSILGKGSTFWFTLPASKIAPKQVSQEESHS